MLLIIVRRPNAWGSRVSAQLIFPCCLGVGVRRRPSNLGAKPAPHPTKARAQRLLGFGRDAGHSARTTAPPAVLTIDRACGGIPAPAATGRRRPPLTWARGAGLCLASIAHVDADQPRHQSNECNGPAEEDHHTCEGFSASAPQFIPQKGGEPYNACCAEPDVTTFAASPPRAGSAGTDCARGMTARLDKTRAGILIQDDAHGAG